MKRLLLFLLCFCLTGCSYLGATEEILISSPYELTVSTIETFGSVPITTPAVTVPNENGDTAESGDTGETTVITEPPMPAVTTLILSTSTKKIHYYEACSYAASIMDKNRKTASAEHEDELIAEGYTVCSWCAKKRGE